MQDIKIKLHCAQELEIEVTKKDEHLVEIRQELEKIKSVLQTVDKSSEEKITQLKESISSKEMELNNYRLEIEALKACKAELQNDLVTTQKEAQELKENICEKDKIIDSFKTDNQKIAEELEGLRQVLKQSDLVAQKEVN
jgi:chromosome segregation ATPase